MTRPIKAPKSKSPRANSLRLSHHKSPNANFKAPINDLTTVDEQASQTLTDELAHQPLGISQGGQRLHKLLANMGLGSRRDMETLIGTGRITVNGQIAQVGVVVNEYDVVRLDSRILHLPFIAELPQVLIYHKPEGEIVSQDDPEGRATVFDKLPRIKQGKWLAIGRLDINTSGLLIFTNSGELANRLMHPRYEVEREYAVRILGELSADQLAQLKHGIELDDGMANFESIYATGGEGANKWYQVVIKEGRNREVRRLFEALQLPVSRLMRIRFGPISLPSRVKRGTMLKLEQKQVVSLLEWAGLPTPHGPLKQLSPREKDKITRVFVPKVRKQRRSVLDAPPRKDGGASTDTQRATKGNAKPSSKHSTSRRIRSDSDLARVAQRNNVGAEKKSSKRNRDR